MGRLDSEQALLATRPFRSPHHTISDAGMVGGGSTPAPGEISLAHHGVLFLDELPEFNRKSLEMMRQPLEEGKVTISRALTSSTFPASFILVAAMNPCPCGYLGDGKRPCKCWLQQIEKYMGRIMHGHKQAGLTGLSPPREKRPRLLRNDLRTGVWAGFPCAALPLFAAAIRK